MTARKESVILILTRNSFPHSPFKIAYYFTAKFVYLRIQSDIPFYENIDQTVTRVQRARMMEENPVSHLKIQQGFEIAKETYAACGVDVEAAIARAKARKQEQQASDEPAAPAEPVDPRKAAVEAAIARAKAREQAQLASDEPAAPSLEPVDPRKAAIAAAIARAKAKKDAQQQVVNEE